MTNNKILHIFEIDQSTGSFIKQSLKNHNPSIYKDLLSKFFEYKYSWSNTIKNSFKSFDVEVIIGNSPELQKLWMKEYINEDLKEFDKTKIIKEQIKYYKAKKVLFQNLKTFEAIHSHLKAENIKSIVYDGVGYNSKFVGKNSDIIFSCMNSSINFYKNFNKNCLYLPHAFDESIKLPNAKKNNDIIFIGSVENKDHFDRVLFLNKIHKKFKIKLWLGKKPTRTRILKNLIYNFFFKKNFFLLFQYIKALNNLFKDNLGVLFGIDMYKKLNESLITVNFHIDKSNNEASNMRIFETTGSGICLITENQINIKNFFDVNKDIVVYDNLDDAIKKIEYYLTNKKLAIDIGNNGRNKTLKFHTMSSRWNDLENFIKKTGI